MHRLGFYLLGLFITVLACFYTKNVDAMDLDGIVAIKTEVNPKSEEDIDVSLDYLSISSKNKIFEIYAVHRAEIDTFYIEEAFIKFSKYGVDFSLGRIIQPFGVTRLSRPESSVFVTIPRYDRINDAIGLSHKFRLFDVDLLYSGNGNFTIDVGLNNIKQIFNPSIGYTNIECLNREFGNWSLSNEIYVNNIYVNFFNVFEWMPDVGSVWTRSVITPGSYNALGVFFSYYKTSVMNETLVVWDKDYQDIFTYGIFIDLFKDVTISIECISDDSFMPISIYCVSKF